MPISQREIVSPGKEPEGGVAGSYASARGSRGLSAIGFEESCPKPGGKRNAADGASQPQAQRRGVRLESDTARRKQIRWITAVSVRNWYNQHTQKNADVNILRPTLQDEIAIPEIAIW